MSLLREPLLTRSTAEGEKLKPRAGSHYRLIFILAGWKKKVTQLEMKIKLITLGFHFNQVKIKNFNHRQSAGKLTCTWTNHAGPNRALYITILVLLFSAIQKQRNQLLAFVFVMDRWLNSCNCCCHLEGMKWLSATITTSAICMVTSTSRSHHPRGFFWAAAENEETNLQYGSWHIRC